MENIQQIETAYGSIEVKDATFYENGNLKTAEPMEPVFIKHETGLYIAYDDTPLKDEEHLPTLELSEDGSIKALRTVGTGLICIPKEGKAFRIEAQWRPDPRDTGANVIIPIYIRFSKDDIYVIDSDGKEIRLPLKDYDIEVDYVTDNIVKASGCGDCSTCNGCSR
ncbi:MAG: hypothetical protein EOM34_01910 [Clostridia bacterium]|nr:hypothetical protein [Lachnospiraceae bacterium]NCB99415.1 hypothetical protein [Clostridia bacterium]NCD01482.1 hypothetical protein [Clostridia bacterium]